MTASNQTLAPGGWGWPPGYVIGGTVTLPDLPLLQVLRGSERAAVLAAELSKLPALHLVRQCDIEKKYAVPKATANAVLDRARRF